MRHATLALACFLLSAAAIAQEASPPLCQPWQAPYADADATGGHVIGLWTFAAGAETADSSGHHLDLKLAGAGAVKDDRFGSCLESFPGYPVADKQHAAVVANRPSLTPHGAFTLEMWIKPKADFANYPEAFLLDKKYVANADYQMILSAADKAGSRRLSVHLGFGDDSDGWTSDPAKYETGVWHHIAFTYDGAGGGRFWRDGAAMGGSVKPGRAAITAGKHPLSIGDRIGSYFHGFPGFIAQVRICNGVLEFRPAAVTLTSDRTSFVRMEKAAALQLTVANLRRTHLIGAEVTFSLDGLCEKTVKLPDLDAGASHVVEYPLDTTLRPDAYKLRAALHIPGPPAYDSEESIPIVIVPRPLPRMPVVMWGIGGVENVLKELPRLKHIGFTHCLGLGANYAEIFAAGKAVPPDKPEKVAAAKRMLNTALANDLGIVVSLSPGHWATERREFLRVNRQGKTQDKRPDICGLLPPLSDFCRHVGESVAQAYGTFPAFQAALIHTEVRDAANLCFHDADRDAYRKATGLEIPPEVMDKGGVDYTKLKGFPADRVIPDDHPLLQYYRWFWKAGDGWNGLTSAVHQGLKSTGRTDLWTFHDPAVRVASVYGSGGDVDVISQWTYSYPDPIRIGMSTDELLAMAKGASHPQGVMKMTQIIWYRSQTAPASKGDAAAKAPRSPWEDTDPDAAFPTIAPMHLREAFWSKISRPIRGIMYHGWQSLVPTDDTGGYRYTNPQTQHELRRLVKEVVEPLGATLLQVPDRPSDVGFLESFASQMFAHRGTYGWNNGWAGDAYHVMQYAQLQPEILYDETILQRGLVGFRVLVMMDCDVLTAGVAKKVQEFQKAGGIVVGDERLCPAIKPDIVLESYTRTRKADEDRAALVGRAGKLRAALDGRYRRYADSSNPDVVTRCRSAGAADYLFAVNDRREFGDYVGQHGLVMENGLPSQATLLLDRKAGHVYDLLAGEEVSPLRGGAPVPPRAVSASKTGGGTGAPPPETSASAGAGGMLGIPVALGPCEGRVFLVTGEAIAAVRVEGPNAAKPGQPAVCKIAIADAAGRPVQAVIPLRVDIRDPAGRDAEFSGFYGAKDGQLDLRLDFAANDSPGVWQIRVRELASGRTADHYIRLSLP